ncbi:MAG TPA: hypothetical protein VI172_12860 [Candidatus Dormibacteraeota bacterium]|jgi:ABC-type cobalamin transport system ATPase subunit
MTEAEKRVLIQLQGEAAEAWAGTRALRALAKIAAQEGPKGRTPMWDSEYRALAKLADQVAKTIDGLACKLDPFAIEQRAEEAAN